MQVGAWTYNITNADNRDQRVAVSVTSMSAEEGEYPIIAQAFWGTRSMDLKGNYGEQIIYASVSKGSFSINLSMPWLFLKSYVADSRIKL